MNNVYLSPHPRSHRHGSFGTTTRYKISLNGLGVVNGELEIVSVMLKTGMEVSDDCTVFKY